MLKIKTQMNQLTQLPLIGARVHSVFHKDCQGTVRAISCNPDMVYVQWDNEALNYGADGKQLGSWEENQAIQAL